MKTTTIKLFYPILFAVTLFSCNSMITDVDGPKTKPKLVVYSYLKPGHDTTYVTVTQSKPLYTTQPSSNDGLIVIDNAGVKISDGNQTKTLLFDYSTKKYFTTDIEIEAGKTYWLEVVSPSGDKASAHCTIPFKPVPTLEILGVETHPEDPTQKRISFRFADGPGEGDLYRLNALFTTHYDPWSEETFSYPVPMMNNEEFINDKGRDGEFYTYKTNWIYLGFQEDSHVTIAITIIDENYYNYHRSIYNFQGDNPFSEPTPIFSNIDGGLGVFAGYDSCKISVNLGHR